MQQNQLSKSTRLDKEGNAIEVITKSIHNITVYLKTDPVYQAFIGFDAFQQKTYVLTQPPWDRRHRWEPRPWEDHDDLALAATLQVSWMNVSPTMACDAVELVAHANTYHPLKDYLESLQWDGAPRLDAWVIDYLGAEDSDYTRAVSAKWLISTVARVYQPGCKADHALILESQQQGIGKSTALRVLAGDEYFSDSTLDIGNKDAMQRLAGVWIVEMAELEAFNRKESEQIKAFISSTTDKYRPAYGRRTMSVPRQCVFAGTVNDAAYLKDHTGNRRFWAVKCHQQADIAALEAQRDQIWAEAVYRFKAGEAWHLTDPAVIDEAIKQQASREVPLLWEENIRLYLGTRVNVSIEEILDECLKIEVAQRRQPDYNAVSKVLQKLCWVRYNARVPVTPANLNGRQWRYRPATPPQGKKDKQTGTTQQEQHQEQNHRRESERQEDGSSGFQYGSSVSTSQNPHGSYVGSTGSSGSSISIEEATLVDIRDTGIGSESKKGCGIDPYIEKSGSNLSHWNQPSKNAGSSDFDTGTTQPQTGTTPHSFNDSPSCTTCARYAPRAHTCGAELGYVADVERPPCGGAQFEVVFDKRQEKKND